MFKDTSAGKRGLWKEFYASQVKKYWYIYLAGILAVMITNITEVLVPKFSQWAIDLVSGNTASLPDFIKNKEDPLMFLGLLLGVNVVIAFFTRAGWRQFLGKRTHYAGRKIRKELWANLSKQNLNVFGSYPIGDLVNRSITDINPARFILGFTIVMSSDIIFFCLLGTAMMFQINVTIASAVLVIFLFLPLIIYPIIRKEYDLHDTAQETLSSLSDSISQMLNSVRLQKITGMEKPWLDRLGRESKSYANDQLTLERTAWTVFPVSNIVVVLAYSAILGIGLYEFRSGSLTAGEFVALISLVAIISGPVIEVAINILEWQKGLSSLDRICEVIQLEGDTLDSHEQKIKLDLDEYTLEVKDLSFAYSATQPFVLDRVSKTLKQGKSLGITGKVGSGKSTFLNIVAGIQKSCPGHVYINGIDISELNRREITGLISLVSQTPFLFAGSVKENLSLEKQFSDEKLWEVLADVGLKEDFEKFDDQLETQIGEWGISLSGGQKQRLALARNLLRPRPIMLFDDCLSAVDTKTEALIQNSIKRIAKNSILVWVAHRKSTIGSCDEVADLDNGRFVDA
ncbi:ABC transporter ATP-binding protein/permease [bacterium]|nr:ABC transporter ATP-binding protein/permease [bacterium]